MNDLIRRLSQGEHPVTIGGSLRTPKEVGMRVEEMGYVSIKFTGTRGGTDLGVRVDRAATDTSRANFTAGTGTIHVEGTLTLDDVKVRCIADIDLATLDGTGHLLVLEEVAS